MTKQTRSTHQRRSAHAATASSHSRTGRSPTRFDRLTASARSRAFSSRSDRTLWIPLTWRFIVWKARRLFKQRRQKVEKFVTPMSRDTTLSAARSSALRRSCLLCGGRPMPMASPQFRTCPQSFPSSIESRANLSPKWDRARGSAFRNRGSNYPERATVLHPPAQASVMLETGHLGHRGAFGHLLPSFGRVWGGG